MGRQDRGPRPYLRTGRQHDDDDRALMTELLGLVLARYRREARMGQTTVARRLEIPQSTISRLERGETTLSVYYLDRYGESVGVEGWEIYRRACTLAELLVEEGISIWWEVDAASKDLVLRRRDLARTVAVFWRRAEKRERKEERSN